MARNRQRAKQRQAERRAARLAQASPDALRRQEALEEAELFAGAPPEDAGRSDTVVEHPPPAPELDGDDEDLEEALDLGPEPLEPRDAGDGLAAPARPARARRAREEAERREPRHHRNRLIAFLIAVWAELQRVEWPNRQALTMLTGVVLLFVVVMGAYLGLVDAIFSKLINKII